MFEGVIGDCRYWCAVRVAYGLELGGHCVLGLEVGDRRDVTFGAMFG